MNALEKVGTTAEPDTIGHFNVDVPVFTERFGAEVTVAAVGESAQATDVAPNQDRVFFGGYLVVSMRQRTVAVDGLPSAPAKTTFNIIDLLTRTPDVLVTRRAIIDYCWEGGYRSPDDKIIDTYMTKVRRVFGPLVALCVETRTGCGFILHTEAGLPEPTPNHTSE